MQGLELFNFLLVVGIVLTGFIIVFMYFIKSNNITEPEYPDLHEVMCSKCGQRLAFTKDILLLGNVVNVHVEPGHECSE